MSAAKSSSWKRVASSPAASALTAASPTAAASSSSFTESIPSIPDMQLELHQLHAQHAANATTIATLSSSLAATTERFATLAEHLQAQVSHREHTISRLQSLLATLSSSHDVSSAELLSSLSASLASHHAVLTAQQQQLAEQHRRVKQEIHDKHAVLERKKAMEDEIRTLRADMQQGEQRRVADYEALKQRLRQDREQTEAEQLSRQQGREEREEAYRRSVVREIEAEKSALMRRWEEQRRCRRERKERIEQLKRTEAALTAQHRALVQDRELREGEAAQRDRMAAHRQRRLQQAQQRKDEKEESLMLAVIAPPSPPSSPMVSDEQLEQKRDEAERLQREAELLMAEESRLRRRGRQLLHEFTQAQALFHNLLRGLEADEDDDEDDEAEDKTDLTAVEQGRRGMVEWAQMSKRQKVELIKLLYWRSRDEPGSHQPQ